MKCTYQRPEELTVIDEVEMDITFSEDQPQISHHLLSPQLYPIVTPPLWALLPTELSILSMPYFSLTEKSMTQSFFQSSSDTVNSM